MKEKEALKKLLEVLLEYKIQVIVLIIGIISTSAINFCLPLITKRLLDDGFINRDIEIIKISIVIIFTLTFLENFIDIYKEKVRINIQAEIKFKLLKDAFRHLLQIKMQYFKEKSISETLNVIETDVRAISTIADETLLYSALQVVNLLGGIIGLTIINFKLMLLVLLCIPIKGLIARRISVYKKYVTNKYIDNYQSYTKWFDNMIGGITVIRNFGLKRSIQKEFEDRQKQMVHMEKKMEMLMKYNEASDVIVKEILEILIYAIGAYILMKGEITLGSILAFVTYSNYITYPISSILDIQHMILGILPSTQRFFDFMLLEEEGQNGYLLKGEEIESINFNNISFKYVNEYILRNVNFCIKKNEKVAIVGKNGSGKSTLLNLLLRNYENFSGRLYINKQNITNMQIDEYRKLFSVVEQDVYLFNDTLKYNIVLENNIDDMERRYI